MSYKFTDHAMESGVAICDTDIADSNLMNLKYSDKSDFIVEAPNGVLSYSDLTITAATGLKCAFANGIATDKTLENELYTLDSAKTIDVTNACEDMPIFLTDSGLILKNREESNDPSIVKSSSSDSYLYNTKTNFYYDSLGAVVKCGVIGYVSSSGTAITSLISRNAFRATDYNEFKEAEENIKAELTTADNEIEDIRLYLNRIYDGVDLTVKFASEIANFSDPWAWIKNRIVNNNFKGLRIGDYIPVNMNAGTVAGYSIAAQTFRCQIAGINTYKNCGDTTIGNHIDFIAKEVINTPIKWNPTDNNNGTSAQNHPWLASALYAILNGVNNYSTAAYGSQAHGANANGAGIFQLLPQALRNQIIEKRDLIDSRYSASAYLTYSTGWSWQNVGKLWAPKELEVYGAQVRSNLGYAQGYWNPENGLSAAYPLFANQARNRVLRNSSGARCHWWLSSPTANYSASVCSVHAHGNATSYAAPISTICAPLCFRIG